MSQPYLDHETVDRLKGFVPPGDRDCVCRSVQLPDQPGRRAHSLETWIPCGCWDIGPYTKKIPWTYRYASIDQRVALLQGLMDSDGCVANANGTGVEYSTASEALAARRDRTRPVFRGIPQPSPRKSPPTNTKGRSSKAVCPTASTSRSRTGSSRSCCREKPTCTNRRQSTSLRGRSRALNSSVARNASASSSSPPITCM